MTTQDIFFLITAFKKGADFCRGDIDYWLSKDELNEIFHTLRFEANCIDFLSHGEKVRPVAMELRKALREFLDCAAGATGEDCQQQWQLKESARGRFKKWFDPNPKVIKLFDNDPEEIYPSTIIAEGVVSFCEAWINWIDTYFPPVEAQAAARPGATVKDFMLIDSDDEKERLLKTLHTLIDRERGKGSALAVLVCMELGLITKPAFSAMLAEFPGIGSKQGFDRYFNKGYSAYRSQEIDGIRAHLVEFQSSI